MYITWKELPFPCLISLSFFPFFLPSQRYYTDAEDLQQAVNIGNPGDVFIVSNGNYNDFEASFTAIATEAQPTVIKAETIGGVTFTGESHFTFTDYNGLLW